MEIENIQIEYFEKNLIKELLKKKSWQGRKTRRDNTDYRANKSKLPPLL